MSPSLPQPAASTQQDPTSQILFRQSRVLDLIANGGELGEVLAEFCLTVEDSLSGARCSVMLLDENGENLAPEAGPGLPREFLDALTGIPAGLAPGSSSAAVYRNQTVISSDLESDPLWDGLGEQAAAAGIGACWSAPIRSTGWGAGEGAEEEVRLFGTLDCYFDEPRRPDEEETRFLAIAAALAGLAINTSRAQRSVGRQQLYDPVTGLPNRRVFTRELRRVIGELSPQGDKLAVVLVDLDHFKEVNDTFGYAVGDFLLRSVAQRLLEFRDGTDLVGRFGDDEFALMISEIERGEEVRELVERVLREVSRPHDFGGQELKISASIGGSIFPWDGEDGQTLLRNAENALSTAKKQGRSHYRLYAPTMGGYAFEKLQLKMALGYALENRELEVLYQPKVDGASQRIVGAEALVYWNNPAMGRIGPSRFIPLAEETGQIVPIGEWVLKTACRQAQSWRSTYPDLTVAVNISAIQFRDRAFADTVRAIVGNSGLDPNAIEIEITESVAMHEVEKTLDRLNELARLGLHISIDDFGTGYSSLAYLKRFPINTLKIDKSFVLTTPEDKENTAIVKAVVALAHLLGLSVVAEGVENAQQAAYLRQEGCEILQGFHFSRPVDARAFSRLLKSGFADPSA